MASVTSPPSSQDLPDRRAQIKVRTLRTDRWWLQPLLTATVLILFIIYSTTARSLAPTTTPRP